MDTAVGILLPEPLVPGSPEWLQKMSGSKIAAVLGLSPYDSPFSIWHKMKGTVAQAVNDEMRRGLYLEPAIAAWFADVHPDWSLETTGTWQRDWQIASPDRMVYKPTPPHVALLELKSAADGVWGDPGTGDVPVEIRAQCLWQLDVTGLDTCHVAMIGPYLEFAEYVVERDEADMAFMRQRAMEFLATLERDERPPIDGHAETYVAIKSMHPDIADTDVELTPGLARDYCTAKHLAKAAKVHEQMLTSEVADVLGTAHRARFGGRTIAQRQAKGGGIPYVVAAKNLPTFTDESATTQGES